MFSRDELRDLVSRCDQRFLLTEFNLFFQFLNIGFPVTGLVLSELEVTNLA